MTDILITNVTAITMDKNRRVLTNAAIAIEGEKIVAIGPRAEVEVAYGDAKTHLDGTRMVAMPGLIDAHAHAGHGLIKTMGIGVGDAWNDACQQIYTTGSDIEYWRAESALAALERIKCGTTLGVSYLGGGDDVMRVDDPAYSEAYFQSVVQAGTRSILCVGANRPPFPVTYADWKDGKPVEKQITFVDQLATCETVAKTWHGKENGRLRVALTFPVHHPDESDYTAAEVDEIKEQAHALRNVSKQLGVMFTQDGHRNGSIALAHHQFDLLGPDAFLSHCTNMSPVEIEIARETGTKIVHNPSANASIKGRCPVPELLDAGVTVMLGSDGTAPDRSADMFRHMFQCMHYHRTFFKDARILPAGKTLEMTTIDAARGFGLEEELGSLEVGKQADLILIDMFKPHLVPANMPVERVVYFATGSDVDTTIVAGEILMQGREVKSLDEGTVLEDAETATAQMLERTGLDTLLTSPDGFWGHSRLPG